MQFTAKQIWLLGVISVALQGLTSLSWQTLPIHVDTAWYTFAASLISYTQGIIIYVIGSQGVKPPEFPEKPTVIVPPKGIILIVIMVLGALAFSITPVNAQANKVEKAIQDISKRNDANAPGGTSQVGIFNNKGTEIGDTKCRATGDAVADLHCVIQAGGKKLILHLKQSYALAMGSTVSGGSADSKADNTSATCTKALVPIVDLVVNGPKPGTITDTDPMALTADEKTEAANTSEPAGPIVVIEKLRILRLAIQSPALNDACGALVQDEVKQGQNLIGKLTSLITGVGILAPVGL